MKKNYLLLLIFLFFKSCLFAPELNMPDASRLEYAFNSDLNFGEERRAVFKKQYKKALKKINDSWTFYKDTDEKDAYKFIYSLIDSHHKLKDRSINNLQEPQALKAVKETRKKEFEETEHLKNFFNFHNSFYTFFIVFCLYTSKFIFLENA